MKSRNVCLLLMALLVGISGCGDNAKFNVRGTVLLDGKPVESGSVVFVPAESGLTQAFAKIDSGAYETTGTEGMVPGKYKIVIKGYEDTGRVSRDAMTGEKAILKQVVPDQYNAKTTLFRDVSPETTQYDFDLKSQ